MVSQDQLNCENPSLILQAKIPQSEHTFNQLPLSPLDRALASRTRSAGGIDWRGGDGSMLCWGWIAMTALDGVH